MSGTDAYADHLNQFATAGGRPKPNGTTLYYAVTPTDGVAGLTQAFREVAAQAVAACVVPLEAELTDPSGQYRRRMRNRDRRLDPRYE